MARRARPWYRSDRGAWFVQLKGKQHNLGITDPEDLAGAVARLEALLAQIGTHPDLNRPAPGRTVAEAVNGHLADLKARADAGKVSRGHYNNTRIFLEKFAAAFPDAQVSLLKADQVEKWVTTRPWSSSYQHDAMGAIIGLLRGEGVSLKLRKPRKRSRGAATCLTDDQFDAVIRDLSRFDRRKRGDLAQLMRLLRETGARPDEACGLTVEAIDWANHCVRLAEHKTAEATGEDRIIYFNTAAMAILHAQREKWGTGLLFRSKTGRRYTPSSFGSTLRDCSKRVGFRVIAYGLGRHSFATNALANGAPDALVAQLLGQKGTKMLYTHYAHLGQRAAALKQAAELASRKG